MKITVVGLGPGDFKYLTFEAYGILMSGKRIFLRTEKHPVVSTLVAKGMKYESFDYVYDKHESFDDVYAEIVRELREKSSSMDSIIYAVPGNPFVAERTVELLAMEKDMELEFIYGPSFIDATLTALGRDPAHGFSVVDAMTIGDSRINTLTDNLFIQVYDNQVASNLKIKLSDHYGDDYECIIVRGAGIEGEEVIKRLPVYELDRTDIMDHLSSVFVPRLREDDRSRRMAFDDLVSIVDKLRGPDGCPWDREQTHDTLKEHLIEESYEVVDAIEKYDLYAMEEELGDLLLQIVMHAQIASESGYFNVLDVTNSISNKLITRHPHVFGDVEVESSDEVLRNWEEIKLEEKKETVSESMERIPRSLPSLQRAYKVQKKAANVGFDWDDVKDAIEKVREELEEMVAEYNVMDSGRIEEELGDLLFSVVNVCRFFKVNPSGALEKTTQKFIRRFMFVEESAHQKGRRLNDMTLAELDDLWNVAKKSGK
jgi:tetrapyrrole methylase family protein / MazG family protein